MKRYYCKHCKSIIINNVNGVSESICAYCGDGNFLVELPEYETVEQYKKRTGEEYPDDGIVFTRLRWNGLWGVVPWGELKPSREFMFSICVPVPVIRPPKNEELY